MSRSDAAAVSVQLQADHATAPAGESCLDSFAGLFLTPALQPIAHLAAIAVLQDAEASAAVTRRPPAERAVFYAAAFAPMALLSDFAMTDGTMPMPEDLCHAVLRELHLQGHASSSLCVLAASLRSAGALSSPKDGHTGTCDDGGLELLSLPAAFDRAALLAEPSFVDVSDVYLTRLLPFMAMP